MSRARPTTAVVAKRPDFKKENNNVVLRFGLFADCDPGRGIRIRRGSNCISGDREDSILRFHRTVPRVVDYPHVAAGLGRESEGALYR